jgi:predicted phosphodiesterase
MVPAAGTHLFLGLTVTALVLCGCRAETAVGAVPVVRETAIAGLVPDTVALPNVPGSVKFAIIGDSGRGNRPQREVAERMVRYHDRFAFPFTLMLGDNLYEGRATPRDYRLKFEEPYATLLARGVEFFAVLGNHDDPRQVYYDDFNMKGRRFYSFAPPGSPLPGLATTARTRAVEFFAIDSTYLDGEQLKWLDERLDASRADWKICFLHHPVYTSGRYRMPSVVQRSALESMLVRHNVNVVFSGHEHIYQRSTLQNGIQYFVSGGAGSLRRGDGVPTSFIARSYAADYHFMLVEIEGDNLHFQAISRTGRTIDAGTLSRTGRTPPVPRRLTALGTAYRR